MLNTTWIRPVKAPCADHVEKNVKLQHLVSECEKYAQKEYEGWHKNVAKKVQWDLCKKNGLQHTGKWYEHVPERALENEEVKVLWDVNV